MNEFLHENPDFAVWVMLVVLTYAATLAILVRLRRADPAAMRIAAVGTLALLLATYLSLQETKSRELRRIGGLLIQSAPAYAKEMEKMGHAQIALDTPADDPRYLNIINETLQWIRLNPIVKGIYTCRRTGDGKIVLIVDPEVDIDGNGKIEGLEVRTPIGTPWEAEIPDIEAAFSGKTVMTGKPYKDEWGEWLTAFSPVRNAQGKVEAVLGVDYPAAQWMVLVQKACLMHLLGWGFLATVFLGGCGFVSALSCDLRQRRRIEEQLRDTEERFRHLAEQSRDLVLEFDVPSRRICYASPNHLQVTGFSPSHLIGRDMLTTVHPEDKQLVAQALEKEKFTATFRMQRQGGGWLWMELAGARYQGVNGESRVQAVCRDVTDRKISEDKLQRAQRMESLGQMAAGVAHDLNNVLTVVQGYGELMIESKDLSAKHESMLRLIDEAAARAAGLTRKLLAFGCVQTLQRTIVNLKNVAAGMKPMLQSLLGEQIQLHCLLEENTPDITADFGMIEQVILNITLNARDAMPEGGHLSIRTSRVELDDAEASRRPEARAGTFACLSINDTGFGMDEETQGRLFEPFFTTKEFGTGTGLGLASAYGVINQHGGWIEVTSHLGAGSKFDIFLPITTATSTAAHEMPEPGVCTKAGSESILIVEDEPALLQLAETILTSQGYKVQSAHSGREALASLRNGGLDCDLLMTDLVMPGGISGGQLAKLLRNKKPDLRGLFTTGYSPDAIGGGLNLQEGYNYLPKPYNGHKLARAVRDCLDAAEAKS